VCYIPCPSHPPWFDHPNNIWWGVLQSHVTTSLLVPNIFFNNLISNTLSLHSSQNIRHTVSCTHKQIKILFCIF
jgi:hypothetical protein